MSDEQLLFQAAIALDEAQAVIKLMWDKNIKPNRAATVRLMLAARALNCSAVALDQRSAGVKPPKIGD